MDKPQTFTLILDVAEISTVYEALQKMPFGRAESTVLKIRAEIDKANKKEIKEVEEPTL